MSYKKTAYWIIGFTIIFAFGTLILFLTKTTPIDLSSPISIEAFSAYGTLVGGISAALLSLASVLLIIQTLTGQEKYFQKQKIESTFYELLNIHRENSNGINIKNRTGKKIFLSLIREFNAGYDLVKVADASSESNLIDKDLVNVSHLCFFFGVVGEYSERLIKSRLEKYSPRLVTDIIKLFNMKQLASEVDLELGYVPFEGHQSHLGHYFRHLFQAVRFINEQNSEYLSYKEKYKYIKTLRAQLSTQEQALLFYNSLSDLGDAWELKNGTILDNQLVTKYNLIKNIPSGFKSKVEVKFYYPNVHYEGLDEKSDERRNLEKQFN